MLRDISLLPVLLEGCLEDSAAVRFPGARAERIGKARKVLIETVPKERIKCTE